MGYIRGFRLYCYSKYIVFQTFCVAEYFKKISIRETSAHLYFLNIQNLIKISAIFPKITKNGVMHRSIMVPSSGIIDFDLWFGLLL